jgi:hypothetical protein
MNNLFLLVVATTFLAGCTAVLGERPVAGIEPRSERDRNGNPVQGVPGIMVQQYGTFPTTYYQLPPASSPVTYSQPPTSPVVVAQAVTAPSPPETTPLPPAATPKPLPPSSTTVETKPSYRTLFATKWDDPTLVVVRNVSARFISLKIDDAAEIIQIGPCSSTGDLSLDEGPHILRIRTEIPTAFGPKISEQEYPLSIRRTGSPKITMVGLSHDC